MHKTTITVNATIDAPVDAVWEQYTAPQHIVQWNAASEDWHTPHARNDVHTGGTFTFRMEAKNKSAGFDFNGTYTEVKKHERLSYKMEDGREAHITFSEHEGKTHVSVTFDAEHENSVDLQRNGWQAILNNFKMYVERNQ